MTPETLLEPIKIETVSDAMVALKRSKGSFEEWLDCARIFSANRMWEELEKSARRAMEAATNRPLRPLLLKEAAMRFAAGSLKNFSSKSEFKNNCDETIQSLREFSKLFPIESDRIKTYFDSIIEALDEILILLADGSSQALVSIASKLRKIIGRPDLSIIVAGVALQLDSEQYAAHTTRGSAFTEMEEFAKALSDFSIAEKDPKSRPYAIAGHTKLLITQGNFNYALEIGSELLKSKHSRPMLYMLAAAAKGAGDEKKFSWLVKQAEALPDVTPGTGKKLLLRKSIAILIENKQFDIAESLLLQLSEYDKPSRINTLRVQIQKAKSAVSRHLPSIQ
jgi:tetratricopeptide (TPR) repeat protein